MEVKVKYNIVENFIKKNKLSLEEYSKKALISKWNLKRMLYGDHLVKPSVAFNIVVMQKMSLNDFCNFVVKVIK